MTENVFIWQHTGIRECRRHRLRAESISLEKLINTLEITGKLHWSDASLHVDRKIMFKRHIQRTTICHAHDIKAASKLQLRHGLVVNTLEYLI